MRQEFSAKTKLQAWERSKGTCEACGNKIVSGTEYDHRIACEFGGGASLDNCVVLCRPCHAKKTFGEDIPAIAKSRRIRKRVAGIRKPRTITMWRKMNGEIVRAARER